MRKKVSDTRVTGVYPHATGSWRCIYVVNGKEKTKYFETEAGAKAWAADFGKSESPQSRGLSRADWILEIWDQAQRCLAIEDEKIRVDALKAVAAAYGTIREDLHAIDAGVANQDDPTQLSDEQLEAKIIKLQAVSGGKQ